MKEVLDAMVQAVGEQAIALGVVDERVTALKRTLARQFPEIADELKGQIEAEQEQSRAHLYELQVTLARVREAIGRLAGPEAQTDGVVAKQRAAPRTPARTGGKSLRSR